MPLFALALVLFIKLFDSSNTTMPLRLLGLVLCLVLLTQSIDVYLVYVVLAVVLLIRRTIKGRDTKINQADLIGVGFHNV